MPHVRQRPAGAPRPPARIGAPLTALALVVAALVAAACGGPTGADAGPDGDPGELVVGAIPDQDPEQLQRLHGLLAEHLADELGLRVRYVPVTDYTAAVNLFRVGDLDLVWFGGLTGVQARLRTPGAEVVAQRDIDERFRSVFIANVATGIEALDDVVGLRALAGRRLTFGSESSTSGRLMPQWFLREAGVGVDDLAGEPGFSGSHDATIDLVESGTYEVGALNEQVWDARVAAGTVDEGRVRAVLRTPPYADYHWVVGPGAIERHGDDLPRRVLAALEALDRDDADDRRVLDLFGAGAFVPADGSDHARIEEIARDLGLVR